MFDKCPGGLGICDALFSRRSLCLRLALNLLKDCVCRSVGGCPRCIASHSCTDYNSVLDKVRRGGEAEPFVLFRIDCLFFL